MGTISAELVAIDGKRDSSGRKLVGDARREAILGAYDRSDLTQREFAAREGVSYHTLITWLGRRRHEQRAKALAPAAVRFAEVRMPRMKSATEVCLPNGIVILGSDIAEIAALAKALGR